MQTRKLIDHLKEIQKRITAQPETAKIQSAVTEAVALITEREGLANQFAMDLKFVPVSSTHALIVVHQVVELISGYISYLTSGLGAQNSKEQLLAEVEDLIRNRPNPATVRHESEENFVWLGRVSAVIGKWQSVKTIPLNSYLTQLRSLTSKDASGAFAGIMTLLNEARADLRMTTVGPVNVAIEQGAYFDYFDEVRRLLEAASADVLIVDPYLDPDFVSRYLIHVKPSVHIRLLTSKNLATLLPSVEAFCKQFGTQVSIRSSSNLHDRYIIVDHRNCFQSGASFKDGAKKAATTLTEITDAFAAVQKTYEDLWTTGKVER